MRHLHYFDPQLFDFSGHYFNYCEQVQREMRRRDIPIHIYARKGCKVTCGGIRPEPVFTRDIFCEMCFDSKTWAIENFHNGNLAFLSDLLRVAPTRFSSRDVAFFPSIIQNQLHALVPWITSLPPGCRPAIVVLLRFLNHDMAYVRLRENNTLIALYYRFAAQALMRAQPRAVFCVDTPEMAAAYSEILGLPVSTLSVAMEPPMQAEEFYPAGATPPVIGFLGHTNELKGFHLLPDIIEQALALPQAPRFLVQVQSRKPGAGIDMRSALQRLDRLAGPAVQLVEGALAPDRYYELLRSCDIVLLPYSAKFYGSCSSGILSEAIALKKVIIVPEGTVPARQAREYQAGAVFALDASPETLVEAISRAMDDFTSLQAKACSAAQRFSKEQGVTSFWNDLLRAVPEAAA